MPYESTDDLPKNLQEKLPAGAETAYMSALNSAKKKGWDEARSHSYAWGAVKQNYRKDGDKWVKKAMTTKQEKAMLRTASRLRKMVYADFMMKTANPAIAAIARMILPSLRKMGPAVMKKLGPMLQNPEFWQQAGPMLAQLIGNAAGGGQQQRAAGKAIKHVAIAAAKTGTPKEEAGTMAKIFVLAAVETANAHRKNENPRVTEALRLARKMNDELKVIREFA